MSKANPIFLGAGVAIVTPFNPDNTVNFAKLAALVNWQIEQGTKAIIACGTTGESPVLTHDEHVEVIKTCIEAAGGRVPVIAGTGSNDTAYALELSKEAEELGADALLMVTPYYNKASQAGLIKHYTYIADNVNIPIILYNVPSRTGCDIKPATYEALSHHKNITAIKEANSNIAALADTIHLVEDRLCIYSGNDNEIVPLLSLGGHGVISVISNILPYETNQMVELWHKGEVEKSRGLQIKLIDLCAVLFSDVNPIPVKAAMNLMGLNVGHCRMPLSEMSDEGLANLKKVMKAHNLI